MKTFKAFITEAKKTKDATPVPMEHKIPRSGGHGGRAISIDLRNHKGSPEAQADVAHRVANKHFWGHESGVIADRGGHFLGTNMVKKYHVASVHHGMWVAATTDLKPEQTRAMAKKHLGIK